MAFNAGAIIGTAKVDNKGWMKGIKGMKVGMLGLGAAVGVAAKLMVDATKAANEWQKELQNVSTLLDTATVSTQDMAFSLLALDNNLGETTELTKAMYQAFSSGAEDMDQALQVTTDSAKFAKAAVTDISTSVDVLTTASNAYGSELVTTTQASDIFFTTIKQGKLNGEQLASTIGKSIPLFASLNIPLEELGAGMAAMTKQGVNAAESTTQLNGIVNSFLKPSAEMTAALKAQGIESGSALLETQGLSGALEFLEDASGGSKDKLSKLLPSVEAIRGTLALTGKGGEEFAKILNEMETAAGATDVAFAKQNNVLENMQVSFGKVELVVGNIGKVFQDKIAVGATEAADGMLDFLQSAGGMELVGGLVTFVSGSFDVLSAILKPIFETVIPGLSNVVGTLFTEINDIMGATSGATGTFDVLGMVVSTLSVGFKQVVSVAGGVITTIGNLVEAIVLSGNAVGSFFEFLSGKKTWDDVKDSIGEAGVAFKDFGLGAVETFFDVGAELKAAGEEWLNGAISTSKNIESAIVNNFSLAEAEVISKYLAMISGQEEMTEEIIDSNGELTDTVEDQNEDLAESTKSTFETIGQGVLNFIEGIGKKWGDEYDAIVSVIDTGLSAIDSITSLSYQNQFDELELSLNEQMDAIDLFHDNRINGLRELTDEELALDAFKKAEKIALLEASNEEEDKLELAAMLAQEARLESLAIAEQDKADAIALTESAALVESNKIAKSQFDTQQALQIASVWMDAASAIAGFWAVAPLLGPVAGPIFGAAMTGTMLGVAGTQTSLISEQSFVPARETGGMASGLTRINEAGGEIVSLPDGSQVIPNDISREIARDSGSRSNIVEVNFYDTVVGNDMDFETMYNKLTHRLGQDLRRA